MGLDQHRAQITADWLDTSTGETGRARVAPAHRAGVRRFVERFGGCELEVALEATTGWRFVVEELRRVGATVHLAEPAETAARRGNKKRAKNDRADARHLRELVMVGRLPESWIAPEHLLDLRAGAIAAFAGGAAWRVAAAHSGRPLSPRVPPATQPDDRRRPRVARRPGAAGDRARADHGGDRDDRRAREPARADRQAAAQLCPPPARLPRADGPVRRRRDDRGHDTRPARRRAPLLQLA